MTTVYLAPRFVTAIRMPEAINSVVLGDPESFSAEHSEREPQIVFVKPITTKPAQTNLLISTARGYQASLLVISRGEPTGSQPSIDFLMRYRPAERFIIESSDASVSVAQTTALTEPGEKPRQSARWQPASEESSAIARTRRIVPVSFTETTTTTAANGDESPGRDSSSDIDLLLERQRRAPLPVMHGEKPGIAPPGKEIVKAGVSEVIDQGSQVVVLALRREGSFLQGGRFAPWIFWAIVLLTLPQLLLWFSGFGINVPISPGGGTAFLNVLRVDLTNFVNQFVVGVFAPVMAAWMVLRAVIDVSEGRSPLYSVLGVMFLLSIASTLTLLQGWNSGTKFATTDVLAGLWTYTASRILPVAAGFSFAYLANRETPFERSFAARRR